MLRLLLIVECIALSACLLACSTPKKEPPRGSTEPGAKPVASKELQERREKLIQEFLNRGVFKKVTYGKDATIIVDRVFYGLDFEDKVKAVKVVAAYHYKVPKEDSFGDDEDVFLQDSKSGKIIGIFNKNGLNLD